MPVDEQGQAEEEDGLDGDAEVEFAETMAELGQANDRAEELCKEGLDWTYMHKDKAVEFMHYLDRAKAGEARDQYVFARMFLSGTHGAMCEGRRSGPGEKQTGWEWFSGGLKQQWYPSYYWCKKAACQGLGPAEYLLGKLERDGHNQGKDGGYGGADHKAALVWFRRAAEHGEANAERAYRELKKLLVGDAGKWVVNAARMICEARATENHLEAVACMQKASAAVVRKNDGWGSAIYNHLLEDVEPELMADVIRLIERAVEDCDIGGCIKYLLGCLYCHCDGCDRLVAEDYPKGYRLLLAAKEEGNENARKYLSESKRAISHAESLALSEARKSSDPEVILRAGWKLYRMRNKESEQQAFELCKRAYEMSEGSLKLASAYALARCYYFGYGCKKNKKLAVELYREAAEHWFEDPCDDAYTDEYEDALTSLAGYYDNEDDQQTQFQFLKRAARCGYREALDEIANGYRYACSWGVDYEKVLYWM